MGSEDISFLIWLMGNFKKESKIGIVLSFVTFV